MILRTAPRKWRSSLSDQPLYGPQDDRPGSSGAFPAPANGCKGGYYTISQRLTRPAHKTARNCSHKANGGPRMTTSTGAESPLYHKTQPPHRPGTTAEFSTSCSMGVNDEPPRCDGSLCPRCRCRLVLRCSQATAHRPTRRLKDDCATRRAA